MIRNSPLSGRFLGFIFLAIISSFLCGACSGQEVEELKVKTKLITIVKERGSIKGFSWSPAGSLLSYKATLQTNWGCEQDIILVDLEKPGPEEHNTRHLNTDGPLECGSYIEWSQDGKKVILHKGTGICAKSYLIDLESDLRSEISVPDNWVIFWEEYSPVADMIVCNAVHFDTSEWPNIEPERRIVNLEFHRPWRIAIIDLDKSDFRLIPEDSTEGEQFGPSWSADGKSITYYAAESGFESSACSCFRLNLTSGTKVKIYDQGEGFDVVGSSQDGTIDIMAQRDPRRLYYYGAWAVLTDGSGEMWRLTDSLAIRAPTPFYKEVFSPDLRFVADLYIKDNKTFLRIRDVESGKHKLLDAYLQPSDHFPIAWSPDSRRVCYLRQDPQFSFPLIEIMMATMEH